MSNHHEHDARDAIAARARALLGVQPGDDLAASCAELAIDEEELRAVLTGREDRRDVLVLAAIVARFGVDPHWLVTGTFDSASHRIALTEGPDATRTLLLRLVERHAPLHTDSSDDRSAGA